MKPFNHTALLHPPNASRIAIVPKFVVLTIAMLAVSVVCHAQSQPTIDSTIKTTTQPGIDSTIEIVKGDMRAQRNEIISVAMEFSNKDAAAFWPIYRKYEYERSTLNDGRAAIIKEYAEKYPTLTDADASGMTERMLEYDSRDATLKKKYFKEFNKVLPSLTVAKFFQLDHRIDLLMDLKVESSLPPLDQPQQPEQQK